MENYKFDQCSYQDFHLYIIFFNNYDSCAINDGVWLIKTLVYHWPFRPYIRSNFYFSICSIIYQFDEYLLLTGYAPGTVLSAGDTAINKQTDSPAMELMAQDKHHQPNACIVAGSTDHFDKEVGLVTDYSGEPELYGLCPPPKCTC